MHTRLLVASGNPKKVKELQELLGDLPLELASLKSFSNIVEVEEDGKTFRQNAEKKAFEFAKQTGCLTLADDSGLVVDYLNGKPGIYSARFASPAKDDLKNCERLLKLLKGVPWDQRKASFRCAAALATPSKIIHVVEESVSGFITEEMRGKNGFGYDPLFFYSEFAKTFAEIPAAKKHSVSHRGKALREIKRFLGKYLKAN